MDVQPQAGLRARMAIEALRNGVPNRHAVREMGCNQPQAEQQFRQMLDRVTANSDRQTQVQGMLISGDFGTGKSHFLSYLEHLALEQGFACSKIAISKETPLYDLGKFFTSTMQHGRVQNRYGRFIEEILQSRKLRQVGSARLTRWVDDAVLSGVLHPIFAATLHLHDDGRDPDMNSGIESFWAGERIGTADVKRGLRRVGARQYLGFRAPKQAELPPQRLRFALELIKSAGYRGWVVLLDEIELIGAYTPLRRGQAYAEIARWMGSVPGESYPGLVAVGAVTGDFALEVIRPDGRKKDGDYLPPRLENNPKYAHLVPLVEKGMRILDRDNLNLALPDEDDVRGTVETLRQLYHRAYGWEPPAQHVDAGGAGFQGRMRYKVRAAINEWDLRRLYPDESHVPDPVFDRFVHRYKENSETEADDDRDGAA